MKETVITFVSAASGWLVARTKSALVSEHLSHLTSQHGLHELSIRWKKSALSTFLGRLGGFCGRIRKGRACVEEVTDQEPEAEGAVPATSLEAIVTLVHTGGEESTPCPGRITDYNWFSTDSCLSGVARSGNWLGFLSELPPQETSMIWFSALSPDAKAICSYSFRRLRMSQGKWFYFTCSLLEKCDVGHSVELFGHLFYHVATATIPSPPEVINMSVVQDAADLQAFVINSWSSVVLLLYDIIITFDGEVELVWRSKAGLPKILYFVSRYLGLVNAFVSTLVTTFSSSASFCNVFNPVYYLFATIGFGVADGLLLMRVMALYNSKRRLRITLVVFYSLVYLVELIYCIGYIVEQINSGSGTGLDPGCMGESGSGVLAPIFAVLATGPMLALNVVFFGLTLAKLAPSWRESPDVRMPLNALFMRDGALYFAMMSATLFLWTAMPFLLPDRPNITSVAYPWLTVIAPIASSRLFLNLRGLFKPTVPRTGLGGTNSGPLVFRYDETGEYTTNGTVDIEG